VTPKHFHDNATLNIIIYNNNNNNNNNNNKQIFTSNTVWQTTA